MRCGNFSLLIPEGTERGSGHVAMQHDRQWTLRLGNHSHVRCDAEVSIDGKDIGAYRIHAGQTIVLERSFQDSGRFTFLKSSSDGAKSAGIDDVSSDLRGLVQVRFKPERRRDLEKCVKTCGGMNTLRSSGFAPEAASRGLESGITGLTGSSDQQFHTVSNLDYDPSGEVTISVRLVHDSFAQPRRLEPVGRSTPVPAAVE